MGTAEDPSLKILCNDALERLKFLGTSSEGLFQTPSNRISYHIHFVRKSCSWLTAKSWIFFFLVEVY